ncbi:MAG TPA: PASTA domain-containing protein [Streptosporangiaceae bacterium]|nr:PASTA domain-containing protein [Streptosporangiaceae bacterium]
MTEQPPLRDYGRSLAVVMGAWDYKYLVPVQAAKHSFRRIERLLAGPLCGWPRNRMLLLPNVARPGDLPARLITAFDGITDVALFYFVGHGQLAPDDQLCLGLTQSRLEPNLRAATSLRFADIRQALQDSSAAVKIVILDCCFAGLATKSTLEGLTSEFLDRTGGTGAYTMAATSEYATAWYQDEPGLSRPQTYFSKYLADLVEEGIPGLPATLELEKLFRHLQDRLAAAQRPIPRRRAVNDAREFIFAYNAAPPASQRDPEREVARLGRELAETENRRAAADARVAALQAEAVRREKDLARLKEQLATDTGEQRELQHAIDEAARQLEKTRAAQAAAAAPPIPLAEQDPETLHPEVQQTGPSLRHSSSRAAQAEGTHRRLTFLARRKADAHKPGGPSDDPGTPAPEADARITRQSTQSFQGEVRPARRLVHVRPRRGGFIGATGALVAALAISLPFLFGMGAHQPPPGGPRAIVGHGSSAPAAVGSTASSSDPGPASPTAGGHSQSPQPTPSSNVAPVGPTAKPASSSPASHSSSTRSPTSSPTIPSSPVSSIHASHSPASSKSPQLVDIPSTIGMTLTQAADTLQSAGFVVNVVRVNTGTGNVTHYYPVGQAPRGSTVTIYC